MGWQRPTGAGARRELSRALEVTALASLVFARPVLGAFGQSPEVFLARGAGGSDVVLFALTVVAAPTLLLCSAAALTRVAGARVRRGAHLVLLGGLGGLAAWRFGRDLASLDTRALVLPALATGVVLAVARARLTAVGTFLRYAGVLAPLVFLAQFLLLSPAGDLARGGDDSEARAPTAEAPAGGDLPSVVFVVLDALPTAMLLDGDGAIDAELYPNLAGLADEATWYRNYTTWSAYTYEAIPSLLTGLVPGTETVIPDAARYPDNLFTLLAGTHDVHAVEQITRLCPAAVCPSDRDRAFLDLLRTARDWWVDGTTGDLERGARVLPGQLEPDRGDVLLRWIDDIDPGAGDRPGLWFHHVLLPHEPWVLLPDGSRYAALDDEPYGLYLHAGWADIGTEVAIQRQVLQTQAVDRMIGRLLDRLRAGDRYDDTLVVVVGDHGQAFVPLSPLRGVDEAQFEQIAWTPLLMKLPGQTEARVTDVDITSADVLPTISRALGIELAWETDGRAVDPDDHGADDRPKRIVGSAQHVLPAGDDGYIDLDGDEGLARVLAADFVPAEGPRAPWKRTEYGDLLTRRIEDLRRGRPADGTLTVSQLDDLARPGETPLLEFLGTGRLPRGATVAIAVDGRIAALAPAREPLADYRPDAPEGEDSRAVVHALLLDDAIGRPGRVTAYLVSGPVSDPELQPITLRPG